MPDQDAGAGSHGSKDPYVPKGGEDEGGAAQDGRDEHLHEDQKPTKK